MTRSRVFMFLEVTQFMKNLKVLEWSNLVLKKLLKRGLHSAPSQSRSSRNMMRILKWVLWFSSTSSFSLTAKSAGAETCLASPRVKQSANDTLRSHFYRAEISKIRFASSTIKYPDSIRPVTFSCANFQLMRLQMWYLSRVEVSPHPELLSLSFPPCLSVTVIIWRCRHQIPAYLWEALLSWAFSSSLSRSILLSSTRSLITRSGWIPSTGLQASSKSSGLLLFSRTKYIITFSKSTFLPHLSCNLAISLNNSFLAVSEIEIVVLFIKTSQLPKIASKNSHQWK